MRWDLRDTDTSREETKKLATDRAERVAQCNASTRMWAKWKSWVAGNLLRPINAVVLHPALIVLGQVKVSRQVIQLGM